MPNNINGLFAALFMQKSSQNPEAKEFRMRISDHDNEQGYSESMSEGFDTKGVQEMSWLRGGEFTRNLLSLQLQLQTLLEGVGGEGTASLLDGLAQLSESERKRIIPLLSRVVAQIVKGDKRLISAEDKEVKEFEDSLFQSIMCSLGASANDDRIDPEAAKKLEVFPGGKPSRGAVVKSKTTTEKRSIIDLAKARENRRHRFEVPPPEVS